MSVTFPTWALALTEATTPANDSRPARRQRVVESAPTQPNPFVVELDQFDEKKDTTKGDAKQSTKKSEPPTEQSRKNPFTKVHVERTPSALRAAAMTTAVVLGGPGYVPRGETPEAIIVNALVHYAKAGHPVAVDSVAAHALRFAKHMGINWNQRFMPDDLKKLVEAAGGPDALKEDDERIAPSSYQSNPLLRQQAVDLVHLLLLALGYDQLAKEAKAKNNWSKLMKDAQLIHTHANKIATGRGGDSFAAALKHKFVQMGLLVHEPAGEADPEQATGAKKSDPVAEIPPASPKPDAHPGAPKATKSGLKPFTVPSKK